MQLKQLYHQDLNLWRQEVINGIQNKQLENMDWDNLIEEINDMTASERRALRSYTKRLSEHFSSLSIGIVRRNIISVVVKKK
jgi:hypothetical protein